MYFTVLYLIYEVLSETFKLFYYLKIRSSKTSVKRGHEIIGKSIYLIPSREVRLKVFYINYLHLIDFTF